MLGAATSPRVKAVLAREADRPGEAGGQLPAVDLFIRPEGTGGQLFMKAAKTPAGGGRIRRSRARRGAATKAGAAEGCAVRRAKS